MTNPHKLVWSILSLSVLATLAGYAWFAISMSHVVSLLSMTLWLAFSLFLSLLSGWACWSALKNGVAQTRPRGERALVILTAVLGLFAYFGRGHLVNSAERGRA